MKAGFTEVTFSMLLHSQLLSTVPSCSILSGIRSPLAVVEDYYKGLTFEPVDQ